MGRSRADPMLARSCLELPRIGLIHRCNRVPMFEKRVESGGESIHRSDLSKEVKTRDGGTLPRIGSYAVPERSQCWLSIRSRERHTDSERARHGH